MSKSTNLKQNAPKGKNNSHSISKKVKKTNHWCKKLFTYRRACVFGEKLTAWRKTSLSAVLTKQSTKSAHKPLLFIRDPCKGSPLLEKHFDYLPGFHWLSLTRF